MTDRFRSQAAPDAAQAPVRAERRRLAGIAAAVSCAAAVSAVPGCGFRLRGTTDLQFQTLFATFAPGSPVGDVFRRELARNTTTRLVPRQQDAQVVLHVLADVREKDIVAYSAVGRPRQYELRQRLRFRVSDGGDREYIAPSEITLRRDIGASDNALARVDDEAQLFRDMQIDIVNQLLRRLTTVRPAAS
jgi:LPS-assembly lipoprotein